MKCPNCGFNAENNSVCPVCGYQLAPKQQPPQPANPYQGNQPQPQNTYSQPVSRPQYPAQQPVVPNNAQAAPKRGANPWVIVLICVVGIVIITGIVLAVLSGFMTDRISETAQQPTYVTDYDSLDIPSVPGTIDIASIKPKKIGESVEISGCGIATVTKLEKQTAGAPLDPELNGYALTIVFKNTRPSAASTPDLFLDFYDADGNNIFGDVESKIEILYTDYGGEQYRPVESGETSTQIVYFNAKKELKKAYLRLDNYDYSDPQNNEAIYELNFE